MVTRKKWTDYDGQIKLQIPMGKGCFITLEVGKNTSNYDHDMSIKCQNYSTMFNFRPYYLIPVCQMHVSNLTSLDSLSWLPGDKSDLTAWNQFTRQDLRQRESVNPLTWKVESV